MLIVGAGPVGLMTALTLKRAGVDVRVVDQQSELGAATFPVVLHAQSLRLLHALGLDAALFWRGRPITHLAVYSGRERRAVLELPAAAGVTPGAMTLPQDILRRAMTNKLAELGVEIEWDTRLAVLQQDAGAVWGRLIREQPAALRLGAHRLEVEAFEARYVVGADGYLSSVREALGIELVEHGWLQTFAFFDATTHRAGTEAQLTLGDELVGSAYPLQGGQTRFSFQLGRSLHRRLALAELRELLATDMPWYSGEIVSCDWSGVAEFRRALAARMGSGRVWLAGEAAHLTGPLGVHSLNVGLDEASELGQRIAFALANPGEPSFGPHYEARRQRQWRELLGLCERHAVSDRTPEWVRAAAQRLLPCLPASEADLDDLLHQLRLASTNRPPHGQVG